MQTSRKNILEYLAFTLVVTSLAHLAFSWMGFNPTDDGFTLAYSRRILEGQIPHRDFITIRPALSPLLHVPFVLWGGDYTFLASRFFVWFQFATMAWIWTRLINRHLREPFSRIEAYFAALITFALNANIFPAMAWHTIDGLFMATLGFGLILTRENRGITAGYFLLGLAYLCKQNYLFLAPGALLILGHWRHAKYWVAAASPGLLYLAFLFANGGLPDAIAQLSSQGSIFSVGILTYFRENNFFAGVLGGYFLSSLLSPVRSRTPAGVSQNRRFFGSLLFILLPILGGVLYLLIWDIKFFAFFLFGLLLGIVVETNWQHPQVRLRRKEWQILPIVLLTAWSASLSFGYRSPGLAAGILATAAIGYGLTFLPSTEKAAPLKLYTGLAACLLVLAAFAQARSVNIYREQPATKLDFPLDGLISGGNGIRTSENTNLYLKDMQEAIDLARTVASASYTIIPDNPGYWAQAEDLNPLPIDWPLDGELPSDRLFNRVVASFDNQRGELIVIIQKVNAEDMATGFTPLDGHNHSIVRVVQSTYESVGETEYFELYR